MIRSLFRVGRAVIIPTLPAFRGQLLCRIDYDFAKKSKKELDAIEKQKDKQKTREQLGGDIEIVDMNIYQARYEAVVKKLKDQFATVRIGRLDSAAIGSMQIKLGHQNITLNSLAQVNSKGANSCSVTPFDSTQIQQIQKAIRNTNDSLDIKRSEHTLILTQIVQGKDARDKLVQKVKKLMLERREELSRERTRTLDDLKKLKKVIPKDRHKVMEDEAKQLFNKSNKQLDQLQKEKEKELLK